MNDPIAILDPPDLARDIEILRGSGGSDAAIAIRLVTPLGAADVVRLEVRHGTKLIVQRYTDLATLAVDGDVVTWRPRPDETLAIRSGRVDSYRFDLFRPGVGLGALLAGLLIGLDA